MATYYSQADGAWSTLENWDTNAGGGGSHPASVADMDDDTFVIQAGHDIMFDVDMSGFANGIAGLTITGGSTPGMLYCKYSAGGSYHLKIKTGTHIVGTLDTNRGRLLANSDGVWANSTALPFDRKFIIDLQGTAQLQATNLDIKLICTEPATKELTTYGEDYGPADQSTAVNTTTGVIDWGETPPAAGTAVRVRSSGTLPTGLTADDIYYVRTVSGNTCKLSLLNSDAQIVIPSAVGSGNLTMYSGWATSDSSSWGAGKDTPKVLENVTADNWATGDAVTLCDIAPASYDQQRLTLLAINAGTVQLSAAVDSDQYPFAKIILVQRNIEIRSSGTSASQAIVLYVDGDTHGGTLPAIRNVYSTGTTFYGYGIHFGSNAQISSIGWCGSGINGGSGHTATTITGCGNGIYFGSGHTATTITGCGSGINGGSHVLRNTTFSSNTYDLRQVGPLIGYGCALLSGTQNYEYALNYVDHVQQVIYDPVNGSGAVQKGRILAWMCGGTCVSEETPPASPPVTLAFCHKFTFESAEYPLWVDQSVRLRAGQTLTVPVYVKCSQAPNGMTDRPRVQIIDPNETWDSAASKLDEQQVPNDTSTDWQTITVTYRNNDYPKEVIVRVKATNASGSIYWFADLDYHTVAGGDTYGEVTLSKEEGANARGGSGACAKLLPLSTTVYGYWYWYLPVTASTAFTMTFWYWCTSGFNGEIKVTIYDTDQTTVLDASRDVGETADGSWRQYAGHEVTPTATGLCLVRIEILQGAHSAADVIYIDDIAVA